MKEAYTVPDSRLGHQSIAFPHSPAILAAACVSGPKEGRGPVGGQIDMVAKDALYHQESYEKAEKLVQEAEMFLKNRKEVESQNGYKPTAKEAQEYVKSRKLDNNTLKKFTIGYASGGTEVPNGGCNDAKI